MKQLTDQPVFMNQENRQKWLKLSNFQLNNRFYQSILKVRLDNFLGLYYCNNMKKQEVTEVDQEEIFDKVKETVVTCLGVSESDVTMESSFIDDLGQIHWIIVDLIMNLEETFNIEIPDSDAEEKVATVGDVVDYIKNLVD